MGFDYDKGMQRVKTELNAVVEQIYPEAEKWNKDSSMNIDRHESKLRIVENYLSMRKKETDIEKKFSMLKELSEKCYWHSTDYWSDLKKSMSSEEVGFYGNMIIQQASAIGDKHVRDSVRTWSSDYAFAWILNQYDNETLSEFVSEDLLRYAVNYSFNEILAKNTDFKWERDKHVEYLHLVMKYSGLIDPEKIDVGCNPDRVLYDSDYVSLFEDIREKIPYEKASRLVSPILNYIISALETYKFGYSKSSSVEKLENELGRYREYMDSPCMKKILRSRLEKSADGIRIGGRDAHGNVRVTEFLASLSGISQSNLVEIISQRVSSDPDDILESEIPMNWLTPEKARTIRENLFSEVKSNRDNRRKKDIVPDLSKIQKAMGAGFMDQTTGIDIIARDLEKYVGEKRKRSRDSTKHLMGSLKKESVYPSLFEKVVEKAKKSLGEEDKPQKDNKKKVEYTGGKPLHFNEHTKTSQAGLWDF